MIRTSRKFDAVSLAQCGKLLYGPNDIPTNMPTMRGNGEYVLVAILSGTAWQYGQFVHNSSFYQELLKHSNWGQQFLITSLYSIHRTVLINSVGEYNLPHS